MEKNHKNKRTKKNKKRTTGEKKNKNKKNNNTAALSVSRLGIILESAPQIGIYCFVTETKGQTFRGILAFSRPVVTRH